MTRQREQRGLLVIVLAGLLAAPGIVASAGHTGPVEDPNEWRWDLTDTFPIKLDWVQLTSRCSTTDAIEGVHCRQPQRLLTLSLRFDITDANRPVAVDMNPPRVLGVLDDVDQIVNCQIASSRDVREYEELPWDYVWVDENIGYANKLPSCGRTLELVLDPNQPVPSSLSRAERYIYVLYAGEIIEADVAYEIDAEWVDATGDLHVTVLPIDTTHTRTYRIRSYPWRAPRLPESETYGAGGLVEVRNVRLLDNG
ncbi:MAG: hypothetical protein JSW27_11705 [Phycisphaerales bacterium]|nr:MAG: hypothetical protein JSW27_11705 [Phycisphaerales bacterium]